MKLLNDHLHGPAAVLGACEAVEACEVKCATLIVADPPGEGNKTYLSLSIFTDWIGDQCEWRITWEWLDPCYIVFGQPEKGSCTFVCGWETDEKPLVSPTAAVRIMSRLAAVERATGGSVYLKSTSDDVPDNDDGAGG